MKSAGIYRHWPYGRALFVTSDLRVRIWINEEDHLRIMAIVPDFNLELAVERLHQILEHLEAKLDFAHSEKLGFLTSCPTNLGKGCRVSVHVKCSEKDIETFKRKGLDVRAFRGESSSPMDGIYDLSVKRRFGMGDEIMNELFQALADCLL